MNAGWEDLATRAHGLATHLLGRRDFDVLAAASSLDELSEALRKRGFVVPEGAISADVLELTVRRTAAARLRILSRWAGSRNAVLAVIFEDEDRRSLRAILRGAVQGAPADLRLAGIIPTPALPERALRELAAQATPRAVATLLTTWGNPYGSALLRHTESTQPDLLAIDDCLNRTFAARALRGARIAHNRTLVEYVRLVIDLENACAALVLAAGPRTDASAKQAFVEGGRHLSLAAFLQTVSAGEAGAGQRLAVAFRPAGLATAFERWAGDPAAIEHRVLRYRIAALKGAERRDPAGPAAVLGFALRVRAEVLDLRRLIWGIVLRAPRSELGAGLVSV
ncbi:MAG TPA: V-type ATPase subunit [Gemmatimonadales bacterium]|nr:V-type ATPase subunit [Gemmatimonadales bacterium]